LTTNDLSDLRLIVQDGETMLAWNGAWSEQETVEGLNKQFLSYKDNGFGRWAVILKDSGIFVGICGLQWSNTDTDTVLEIGYLFNRSYWHKGYATESAIACRNYAFDVLKYDEVFSLVRDTNYASMNVAIRNGMTIRGRFIKHYKGEAMPHYIFSVRKNDKWFIKQTDEIK